MKLGHPLGGSMRHIALSEAKADDVLAQPVTTSTGAVLCPKGMALTAVMIERLKNAGIGTVVVEGGDAGQSSPQMRLNMLNRRFEGVSDPRFLEVKGYLEKYFASRLQQ